jgi:uncharacterized protein
MDSHFDREAARKNLYEKDRVAKELHEEERKRLLAHALSILTDEFKGSGVEVYLVGSILRPFNFTPHSDVDIVVKNFTGDRFQLWTRLEEQIGRPVEIILFDSCQFKEFIETEGRKVI